MSAALAKRLVSLTARVPRRALIADNRTGDIERRRGDCAHLKACEVAWIEEHGSTQAKCPLGCRGYEQRETVRESVSIASCNGGNVR